MGGKSGGEIEISEYNMSMHVGICAAGEGLELLSVKYGDKEIWSGEASEKSVFAIDKGNLLGGERKEGGAKGMLTWLPGDRHQSLPAYIWSRLGLTRDTAPGFRGLASLFFSGTQDSVTTVETEPGEISGYLALRDELHDSGRAGKYAGFLWGTNNPYLRDIKARVRRAPVGLNPSLALIPIPNSSTGRKQFAANPAHMIFECMTNRDWGLGENISTFDIPAYEACAQTLYDEGLGLNMIWTQQSEIRQFVNEILDHIQGATFVDPRTGKHTMKLLRGDYNANALPQINQSNAKISNFRRKTWGEITNEVTVTITNAETGKEQSVTVQDLGAITVQGGPTPSAKNYYGIPYQKLGIEVGERDLAASVYPIATCDAEVSRAFWDQANSDVLEVSWPEYQIERVIMRVSEVEKGGNTIKLSLYEDIFGAERATYLDPSDTAWEDPAQPPAPLTLYHIGTAPAFMMAAALRADDPGDLDYPEAMSGLIIGPDSDDDVSYDLVTNIRDVNGVVRQETVGNRALAATFILPTGLPAEATSFNVDIAGLRGVAPQQGDFILFSTGPDSTSEIVTVEGRNSGGRLILNRGTLDTVPRDWPAATRGWVIPDAAASPDLTIRAVGEVVSYWPRTRTSLGLLPLNSTSVIMTTLTNRAHRPNRPANVRVNGIGFGSVAVPSGDLTVTWAIRNRTLESTQIVKWGEADLVPEPGQVTQIDLLDVFGAIITSFRNLTGSSFTVPRTAFGGRSSGSIRVVAVSNGMVSLQGHQVEVILS